MGGGEEHMESSSRRTIDRRAVLALGGASAAATMTIAPAPEAEAYDPGRDETRTRYRETDHVKAFYRTNGYETLMK
jgi:hypothetical protein